MAKTMLLKEHKGQIEEAEEGRPCLQKCWNVRPREPSHVLFVCGKNGHVAKDCLGQKLLADSKEKEKANKLGGEKNNDSEGYSDDEEVIDVVAWHNLTIV